MRSMVRNHTNQDFFAHEEITITRIWLKCGLTFQGRILYNHI